jgi:hypothetical protein
MRRALSPMRRSASARHRSDVDPPCSHQVGGLGRSQGGMVVVHARGRRRWAIDGGHLAAYGQGSDRSRWHASRLERVRGLVPLAETPPTTHQSLPLGGVLGSMSDPISWRWLGEHPRFPTHSDRGMVGASVAPDQRHERMFLRGSSERLGQFRKISRVRRRAGPGRKGRRDGSSRRTGGARRPSAPRLLRHRPATSRRR